MPLHFKRCIPKTFNLIFQLRAIVSCSVFVRYRFFDWTRCYLLRVCLPHQHGSSVYHTDMDSLSAAPRQCLIRHAILSQSGPTRRVDCLVPLWEYGRRVSFLKNATMHCPFNEPNRELTTLRMPTCAHIHWAAPDSVKCAFRGRNSALSPVWGWD